MMLTSGTLIIAAGALLCCLGWLIARRHQVADRLHRAPSDISGIWHGWSIFLPVDGFFFEDREAIYRTDAEFRQRGRYVKMIEELPRIFDITGKRLDDTQARSFTGRGRVLNEVDVVIEFRDRGGATSGSMYLAIDSRKEELRGMLVVRPRRRSAPVAVKVLLRRTDRSLPDPEELGLDRIRRLVDAD